MKKQKTYSFKTVIMVLVLTVLLILKSYMMKESTRNIPGFQIKVAITKNIEVPVFTFYIPIGYMLQ